MAITGSVKEFKKKVGWFEFKPLKFNPTLQEMESLGGFLPEDEPEYVGVDKDGNTKVNVVVYGEILNDKNTHLQPRFTLIDKDVVSEKTGKIQYINSVGDTQWAESEEQLQPWFTQFQNKNKEIIGTKGVRKAKVGEEGLLKFVRAWVKVDYFDPKTELFLDLDRIFKGDLSELNEMIGTEMAGTVVAVATIRTVNTEEGESKEYQSVYNKAFLPGSYMRVLRVNSSKKPRVVEKFLEEISGDYGIRDYFVKGELRNYDPSQNIPAGDAVVVGSSDGPDLDDE